MWQYSYLYWGLDKGESHTVQYDFPDGRPTGVYLVQASIDANRAVDESDESNNNLTVPLPVSNSLLPDLVVESIGLSGPFGWG